MKFLADENIDPLLVNWLREIGHDVRAISEFAAGSTDLQVLEAAITESRHLISHDLDFGKLLITAPTRCLGALLIRLPKLDRWQVVSRIQSAWPYIEKDLPGCLIVLTEKSIRARPLDAAGPVDPS